MTRSNWREMCRELVDELHGYASANPHHDSDALVARARAALAQPEPEPVKPTDEELLGLDELEESWSAQADAANSWDELGIDEIIIWAQRQALARRGHQPAPPAEGEVAELVAALRSEAINCTCSTLTNGDLRRAAYLLSIAFATGPEVWEPIAQLPCQRHPTPVPVSERLPELRGMFERILCVARSSGQRPVGNIQLADRLISAVVSWSALPLPAGEVQP